MIVYSACKSPSGSRLGFAFCPSMPPHLNHREENLLHLPVYVVPCSVNHPICRLWNTKPIKHVQVEQSANFHSARWREVITLEGIIDGAEIGRQTMFSIYSQEIQMVPTVHTDAHIRA